VSKANKGLAWSVRLVDELAIAPAKSAWFVLASIRFVPAKSAWSVLASIRSVWLVGWSVWLVGSRLITQEVCLVAKS